MKTKLLFMPGRLVFQQAPAEGDKGPAPAQETQEQKDAREKADAQRTVDNARTAANDKITTVTPKLDKIRKIDPDAANLIEGRLKKITELLEEMKKEDLSLQVTSALNITPALNAIAAAEGRVQKKVDAANAQADVLAADLAEMDAKTLSKGGVKTPPVAELPAGLQGPLPESKATAGLDLKLGQPSGPVFMPPRPAEPTPAAEREGVAITVPGPNADEKKG